MVRLIRLVAVKSFERDGRSYGLAEVFQTSPIEAAILTRRGVARFATDADKPAPKPRRTYKRRDMVPEALEDDPR